MAYDPEWAALIYRAQDACVDIAAVRDELAVTRAETRRLIALARQGFVADGWGMHGAATPVIAEELPDISEEHDVSAVPFSVLLRDGKVLETLSGSDAAKLRDAVERHAGKGTITTAKATLPPLQKVEAPTTEATKDFLARTTEA